MTVVQVFLSPLPLPTSTRSGPQSHVHAHVCVDKPAQIHARRCTRTCTQTVGRLPAMRTFSICGAFTVDFAVFVRKKTSFEKKAKKKIGIQGAIKILIGSSSIFYSNALFISCSHPRFSLRESVVVRTLYTDIWNRWIVSTEDLIKSAHIEIMKFSASTASGEEPISQVR